MADQTRRDNMPDNTVDFRRILLAALCICLPPSTSFGNAASAVTPDPASTVIVDASTTVRMSDSGNDLETLQNIFQDANAPQDGTIAPMGQIISDLKMKRMRILLGDVFCDLDKDGEFVTAHPGEFDLLSEEIDWAVHYHLSRHMAVASNLPRSFIPYGPAEKWTQAVKDRYKSYARQLVNYIVKRSFDGGAPSVIFEVSNELDIADPVPENFDPNDPDHSRWKPLPLGPWGRYLWWIDPATYNIQQFPPPADADAYPYGNDLRRVERGIAPMQKIFGDVIQSIKNDPAFHAHYPGKKIEIAGPAFSGASFALVNYFGKELPTLEEHFLDEMFDPNTDVDPITHKARFNSSLDYFSFHYYGDFRGGNAPQEPGNTSTLKYVTERIRAKLAALGHPETKLFLSEWGPTIFEDTDINYSHKGAAWAAAFLTEAVDDKIAMGSYLIMHDAGGFQPGNLGWASLMDKAITGTSAKYYPKPPANVFKMFAMMTGMRRAVTVPTGKPNLGAFAASDANSAGVVIFNYNSAFTDKPELFSVELNNLPLNGVVSVERYLVDANTSNLHAYLTQPHRPDPDLHKVEQFNAQVHNGQLMLPSRSLGLGVTFWRILR
jgi:hypothetical protein